jgi:hypothetical protein
METNYIYEEVAGGVPIKLWTRGVAVEDEARRQLANAACLPIFFRHHFGQDVYFTRKGAVSAATSPAAWVRAATSFAARATPNPSTVAHTVPASR